MRKNAPISSAFQWQEAYKAQNEEVAQFYAAGCWDWRRAWENRRGTPSKPFTKDDIKEWQEWVESHRGDGTRLAELAKPNTRVVVTGQQAGAGLGPLYSLYKALAAIHWAAKIEQETGEPCLPIFWIASDDHDLEEVASVSWLSREGTRETARIAADNAPLNESVFSTRLDQEKVQDFLRRLEETTAPTEFRDDVLEAIRESMSGRADFESQFAHLLCHWLAPWGLIPMVPRLCSIRDRAAPLIAREIDEPGKSSEAVREVGNRIDAMGLHAPIHRTGKEVNFFLDEGSVRGKVVYTDGAFHVSDPETRAELAVYTPQEMRSLLDAQPERFSPNAVLRPLVQDAALPVAAYIAGPTELVYHGQIGGLYEHFAVPRPAVLPRPNVVLLETKTEKALEKLGLPEEVATIETESQFTARLMAANPANDKLRQLQSEIETLNSRVEALQATVEGFVKDTGVRKAAEKLRDATRDGAEKLEKRLGDYFASLDDERVRARTKLLENLFPGGIPQERSIGWIAPLLVQHGPEIMGKLYRNIVYTAPGFQTVSVSKISREG